MRDLGSDCWVISPQDKLTNSALKNRRNLQLTILADVGQDVIRRWGIFDHEDSKGRAIPYPATFIIGNDGRIEWSYIGRSSRDRPETGDLLKRLADIADKSANS